MFPNDNKLDTNWRVQISANSCKTKSGLLSVEEFASFLFEMLPAELKMNDYTNKEFLDISNKWMEHLLERVEESLRTTQAIVNVLFMHTDTSLWQYDVKVILSINVATSPDDETWKYWDEEKIETRIHQKSGNNKTQTGAVF